MCSAALEAARTVGSTEAEELWLPLSGLPLPPLHGPQTAGMRVRPPAAVVLGFALSSASQLVVLTKPECGQ